MRFGRFSGLVLSLFLPAFYRDVARNWGGIGFLYLLLLFTLTWIPTLIKWQVGYQTFVATEFPKYADKIPDITLKNGKVTSPSKQPFEIKDDVGQLLFVLDTTGKIKSLDETPALFLLTETKLHQREQQRIQITDLAQFPDFEFTAESLKSFIDLIGNWLAVGLFPVMMVLSLIRALVLMLMVSVVGVIVNSVMNTNVSYGGILRIAAVGMTLSVYISLGLDLAGIAVPFWFMIALVLTSGYVAFGTVVSAPPNIFAAELDSEPFEEPPLSPELRDGIKEVRGYD